MHKSYFIGSLAANREENKMRHLKQSKLRDNKEKLFLKRCLNAIRKIDPGTDVILYGSRARGDAEPESDYDLLIVTDGESSLEREDFFRRSLFPIELESEVVITVTLIDRTAWNSALYDAMPFYRNVRRDGVLL